MSPNRHGSIENDQRKIPLHRDFSLIRSERAHHMHANYGARAHAHYTDRGVHYDDLEHVLWWTT